MLQVKCIYVDDDEEHLRDFGRYIEEAWNNRRTGVPIEVTRVSSIEDAREHLVRDAENIHLLIVDIIFGNEPRGLRLLAEARRRWPHIASLGLSVGFGEHPDIKAEESGADRYFSKSFIMTDDPHLVRLGSALEEMLIKRGHDPVPFEDVSVAPFEDDLPLCAQVQYIGIKNVLNLVIKLLSQPLEGVTLGYVSSGLSGAAVLRADCRLRPGERTGATVRHVLLKLAKDQSLIQTEYERRTDAVNLGVPIFVRFINQEPCVSNGWWGIAAEFETRAKTLLQYLIDADEAARVEQTLVELFLEGGLSEVYGNGNPKADQRPNVAIWENLTLSRRARIVLAFDELKELVCRHDVNRVWDFDLVSGFVSEAKRVVDLDEEAFPRGSYHCTSHGDLHGRNVLVDRYGRPRLIDPANIQDLHWASDPARLFADLILSGLNHGADSHEWGNLNGWLESVRALIYDREPSNAAVTAPLGIWTAAVWIRRHVGEFLGPNSRARPTDWEFLLAVALEFLRGSYRVHELPTPKRILGLLAGCETLRAVRERIRSGGFSA